jgi:TldD protein
MKQDLSEVKNIILAPNGLDERHLDRVMNQLVNSNIDYADLYFQYSVGESWSLEDSIVKSGSYGISKGVGARAVNEDKTGYAYSDEIILPALEQAAKAANSIAKGAQNHSIQIASTMPVKPLYPAVNPISALSSKEKIQLLQLADQYARAYDSRVIQVNASLTGEYEVILIMNNEGQLVSDTRPLVRMSISVIVEEKGRRETGFFGGGERSDYTFFSKDDKVKFYAENAAREAITNLSAIEAPAGEMPVVLGPGWPGILLHEAVGHGLEGDFNRKGTSAFSGKIGQQVASPLCTVVDDGTLKNRRGSLTVDDEGLPSQYNVLIEKGILRGYMQDKLNAKLMNMKPTGNGRRESYSEIPMPRMTNTYMLAGESDPEDIIKSVDKGIYAVNFGGGQVDITSGRFVFSINEGYMIEKGKVGAPIKGATLIGSGPDVMKKISMVGNDLALDSGIGVCGKDGQSVPVGVGQPTLRIDAITVGGTKIQ